MRHPVTALLVCCLLAPPAAARGEETPEPTAVLTGRVMLKDGVTPVRNAELVLTDTTRQTRFEEETSRNGRYKLRLPVGTYSLRIAKGMDIYTTPSVYRVSAGVRNQIDFLVIPDFEETAEPDGPDNSAKRGPDPARGPEEVGTIVDVVHEHAERPWRRWAETLGFIGGLLLVGLAAGG